MTFYSNVRNKYKLLLVILLPIVILMGFIGSFLTQDMAAIKRMSQVQKMTVLSQYIVKLIEALQDEVSYSVIYQNNKDKAINKDLLNVRQQVDNSIVNIKDYLSKSDLLIGETKAEMLFDKTINKMDTLNQKRMQLDSGNLSINEVKEYTNEIETEANAKLSEIARNSVDLKISRTLSGVVNLIHEQIAAGEERNLLYVSFQENQIIPESYKELLILIGQQNAFKDAYFELADDAQDDLYRSVNRGQSISESSRMRDVAIAKATTGQFGIDPNQWFEMQSGRIRILVDLEEKLLKQNMDESETIISENKQNLTLLILLISATLIITFILLLINLRSLARELQGEVDILATSGQEIYNSVTETSSATAETATAITETTSTVEELKQTAQISAEKAKDVVDSAEEALKTLESSEKSLNVTIDDMRQIQNRMSIISDSIVKLSEHSQMIGEIIDTVNDLAEQSNLLAVNAAIEAAKAGDQGKGFSVVAQEVRSLAEQSKQATIQVHNILKDVQNATGSVVMAAEQGTKAVIKGVDQSSQTSEAIRSMTTGISRVSQTAKQIAVSSQQQLIGVNQVTIAMCNIKEASNQHVSHLQQIEGGVKGLNEVGQSLRDLVHEYKL